MFLLIGNERIRAGNPEKISIHPMFLLIGKTETAQTPEAYFNTSHVSINPILPKNKNNPESQFQYIPCFY